MTMIFDTLNGKGYEYVTTTTYEDLQTLLALDGSSRKETWKPVLVHRGSVNRRQRCRPAELPYMRVSFLLKPAAVDALQDILDAHGELLPLATEDGIELYVFNTRFMVDALDRERSTIERIEGTEIDVIRKYEFIEEKIRGIDIFRMPIGPRQDYFSARFVERVKKAKLKGTEFIKLWSSE